MIHETKKPRKQPVFKSYAFKLRAVALAKKLNSNTAAAHKLKVTGSTLYNWVIAAANGTLQPPKRGKRPVERDTARRVYSIEFRIAAVRQAAQDKTIAATARRLNVPMQTLHNWAKAEQEGKLGTRVTLSPIEMQELRLACTDRSQKLLDAKLKGGKSADQKLMILKRCQEKLQRSKA